MNNIINNIWKILELEPTRDISAIKRAYAQKARTCHPEEDFEGFLKLREAYQKAVAYAEEHGMPESYAESEEQKPEKTEPEKLEQEKAEPEKLEQEIAEPGKLEREKAEPEKLEREKAEPEKLERKKTEPENLKSEETEGEDAGWFIQESALNPYQDSETLRKFVDLYTGKQRKNSKLWLDYFTSEDFLDAGWDGRFTALLLEQVRRLEKEYPVNREFLNWLCVAYQFQVIRAVYLDPDGSERMEFQFRIGREAQFDGQEAVFEIATKGPAPKRPKGNELAMLYSFAEYRRLIRLAEDGIWNEQAVGECSQIIGCYAAGYITDKCQQRGDMDCERHPAGLRLITHFFRRDDLPEELYRIVWQKLELQTAVMGRAKLFYGGLREQALLRLPELAGQQRESYAKLRKGFHTYAVSTYKSKDKSARATIEDVRMTDAFFARTDFQQALLDRRFVEEEMLHTWVTDARCDYYLERVIRFYEEHGNAPCARQVSDRARQMLKNQEIAARLWADRETVPSETCLTLKNSPFFRHWLNTGFYQARDPESGCQLSEYLNRELPYLPEWSKGFLQVTEDRIRPVSLVLSLDEDDVEIRFHLRYLEFLLNGNQVYRPCLEWERVAKLADTDAFFFLLPVTAATYDRYEAVRAKIRHRLEDTAALEDGRDVIAGCLAGQVCCLPLQGEDGLPLQGEDVLPPESVLPFEMFAENADHLYVCSWMERTGILLLYEQWPYGREPLMDEPLEEVRDAASAKEQSRLLLEETLRPPGIPMERLVNLPDAVYFKPDFQVICRDKAVPSRWSKPVELLKDDVEEEKLEELLTLFADGRGERLELSWKSTIPIGEEQGYEPRRSLVLIKDGGRYACLYFDDFRARSYALLEKPELYGRMNSEIRFLPFRQGTLSGDCIHRSFSSIRRQLGLIFQQVSWPGNVKTGHIWSHAAVVCHGRHKYNLDKQLTGGFPMERAYNRPDAPFYFSLCPYTAVWTDEQGDVQTLEIDERNRDGLQKLLSGFLNNRFSKLRLTWGRENGRRRHIVLLQDGGRFLMAWVSEEDRKAEYHVADVSTYLDVEGKKYPRDTFRGRVIPAYLIHQGVTPLRNALELLLANIENPGIVTEKFAEYAEEKPVKPRSYETLWLELVMDSEKRQAAPHSES